MINLPKCIYCTTELNFLFQRINSDKIFPEYINVLKWSDEISAYLDLGYKEDSLVYCPYCECRINVDFLVEKIKTIKCYIFSDEYIMQENL